MFQVNIDESRITVYVAIMYLANV